MTHPAGDHHGHGRRAAPGAWAVAPLSLLAVATGVLFVRQGPGLAFVVTLSTLFGAMFVWVLVSALAPAKADKSCPRCGSEGLKRLDPDTTRGVTCTACGFADETVSSFYLAEEEGSLEHAVMKERRRKRTGVI